MEDFRISADPRSLQALRMNLNWPGAANRKETAVAPPRAAAVSCSGRMISMRAGSRLRGCAAAVAGWAHLRACPSPAPASIISRPPPGRAVKRETGGAVASPACKKRAHASRIPMTKALCVHPWTTQSARCSAGCPTLLSSRRMTMHGVPGYPASSCADREEMYFCKYAVDTLTFS